MQNARPYAQQQRARDHDVWALPDPDTQPEFYADTASKRAIAWVVDAVLIGILCFFAVIMTVFIGLFFLPVIWMVLSFAYRVVTLANGSATWGMRLMAIEFRNAQGMRFNLGEAFLHTLGYTLSLAVFPLQLVSAVLMMTTARGQGLTDHVMGSVALNRSAAY